MASYANLRGQMGHLPIQNIFHATNEAEATLEAEKKAAQKIQSIARMRQERNAFIKVVLAVIAVQRVYRSFQARREALRKRIRLAEDRNIRVFHYFATLIQSRFRGYMSRKTQYDFHAQRKYIASVTQTSEAVRQKAQEQLDEQLKRMAEAAEENDRTTYRKELERKHHLLSTATISGVYRPPLTVKGYTTVFGTAIEDDLHALAKEQRLSETSRKFKKDLPSTERHAASLPNRVMEPSPPRPDDGSPLTHQGSRGPTVRGRLWGKSALDVKPPLSLQASTAYDAVQSEERYTYSLNKAIAEKMHNNKSFAVRKPNVPKIDAPINIQDPYAASNGAYGKPRSTTK